MAVDLIRQLAKLQKVAMRAEMYEASQFIGAQLADLRKTERERSWPWGRCIWCEIDANRLREATCLDSGGGAPMCEQHFDEMHADRAAGV
jgi:hypothetical protein